jgi:hypothetical protein
VFRGAALTLSFFFLADLIKAKDHADFISGAPKSTIYLSALALASTIILFFLHRAELIKRVTFLSQYWGSSFANVSFLGFFQFNHCTEYERACRQFQRELNQNQLNLENIINRLSALVKLIDDHNLLVAGDRKSMTYYLTIAKQLQGSVELQPRALVNPQIGG